MTKIEAALEGLRQLVMNAPETEDQLPVIAISPPPRAKQSELSVSAQRHISEEYPKLRDCLESQNQLTRLLNQCYTVLRQYGKTADGTDPRDRIFQMVLADYPYHKIEAAFHEYLKRGKDIPTPADILEILDPKTQPLSRAYYSRLVQRVREGAYIDRDERRYIERFEENELKKIRNE